MGLETGSELVIPSGPQINGNETSVDNAALSFAPDNNKNSTRPSQSPQPATPTIAIEPHASQSKHGRVRSSASSSSLPKPLPGANIVYTEKTEDRSQTSPPPSPSPRPPPSSRTAQPQEDSTASIAMPPESSVSLSHTGLAHSNMSKISLQGGGKSILRELTVEEEILSLKVRSLYDSKISPVDVQSLLGSVPSGSIRAGLENNRLSVISAVSNRSSKPQTTPSSARNSIANSAASLNLDTGPSDVEQKAEFELAGGAEDWEDVEADDIDRYGFIMPKARTSPNLSRSGTLNKAAQKRMSTALSLKTSSTRRHHRLGFGRNRPLNNLIIPFNRRKAPEILTSPIAGSAFTERMKSREIQRVAKWQSMATVANKRDIRTTTGGGMNFTFQTSDPKLIERTWKGIPDCWRSAAWWSFLESSAKKHPDSKSSDDLIDCYKNLIDQNSPHDVQIDLDVPRTISSHIMFRRRYRGGQRLLFRVLHAISLYFPDIGYVQGMASLAATFLCYYDEDTTFVMLVRLFELRGIHRLYSNGFGGLMDALNEFDREWLRPSHPSVSSKLEDLDISVLAFGTRWYLTLFNYSIPFAAQLRVWDVFLLLGDEEAGYNPPTPDGFRGSLDVLHATSAGIIDKHSGFVNSSDFEGVMKCLTNWISVDDEDDFMNRARTEWKKRRRRRLVERLPKALLPSVVHRPSTSASRAA